MCCCLTKNTKVHCHPCQKSCVDQSISVYIRVIQRIFYTLYMLTQIIVPSVSCLPWASSNLDTNVCGKLFTAIHHPNVPKRRLKTQLSTLLAYAWNKTTKYSHLETNEASRLVSLWIPEAISFVGFNIAVEHVKRTEYIIKACFFQRLNVEKWDANSGFLKSAQDELESDTRLMFSGELTTAVQELQIT